MLTDPGLPGPVPTTLVGLDVTFSVPVDEAAVRRLAAGGAAGRAAGAMLGGAVEFCRGDRRTTSVAVHDAVAVVQVLRPDLLRTQPCTMSVRLHRRAWSRRHRGGPGPPVAVALGHHRGGGR